MRVNLCGGNACMTKQLLHGTHIGTALNKVRGERVPQGVRMQRLIDVRTLPRSPDDPVMLRDKALLEFMYATGARVSEACGANLDDVDVDGRIARLMGKGSKQRLVPVGSYAWRKSAARCEDAAAYRCAHAPPLP